MFQLPKNKTSTCQSHPFNIYIERELVRFQRKYPASELDYMIIGSK